MLVHWARRGSHPAVAPGSHAHAFHLVIAGVVGHGLVMHCFHWLMEGRAEIEFDARLNGCASIVLRLHILYLLGRHNAVYS